MANIPEKISHKELCLATAQRFCGKLSLYEYKSFASREEPDVLVFDDGRTRLYEIKTSMADFKKDQHKDARKKIKMLWRVEHMDRYVTEKKDDPEHRKMTRQYFKIKHELPEMFYIEPRHLGNERYYVCPWGLIPADKIPEGWGLYWYRKGKFFLQKKSAEFRSNLRIENDLAIHSFRRYASGDSTGILVSKYVLDPRRVKPSNRVKEFTLQEDKSVDYLEAIGIKQDFMVNLEFADTCGVERMEAVKKVAEKYTDEQLAEAYAAIKKSQKEERDFIKSLFVLGIRARNGLSVGETQGSVANE